MKKKLILIILAGIALLTTADNTFARGRAGSKTPHLRSDFRTTSHKFGRSKLRFHRFGSHSKRWQMSSRICRIRITPNFVITHSETKVVQETVVVWITNDNGSKTEVKLTKSKYGGYIGPQGEYYSTMPTEQQLKALYGLDCEPDKGSVIVWFENDDGIEVVVVLTKDGSGYIGPKGERYETMPDIEQLKSIYCK